MSDEKPKIYIANGKKAGYGVNFSICLTKIPAEHIYQFEGKDYVNVTTHERQEPDQYGKSHYMIINTFKPDNSKKEIPTAPPLTQQEAKHEAETNTSPADDLPF